MRSRSSSRIVRRRALRVETEDSSPLGLSVSASRSDRELVVTFVNPRHDSDLQVECTLKGSVADGGTAQILHDADWNACNSFDNPDRVVPKPQPIKVNGSNDTARPAAPVGGNGDPANSLAISRISSAPHRCPNWLAHRFASAPGLASATRRRIGYVGVTVCRPGRTSR